MKKINSQDLYNFVKEKTGDSAEARTMVMINEYGKTFFMAFAIAEERFGINLMPPECLNILEEVYGKRLEKMKPKTIFEKVKLMMQTVDSNPDDEGILDAVEYYLN